MASCWVRPLGGVAGQAHTCSVWSALRHVVDWCGGQWLTCRHAVADCRPDKHPLYFVDEADLTAAGQLLLRPPTSAVRGLLCFTNHDAACWCLVVPWRNGYLASPDAPHSQHKPPYRVRVCIPRVFTVYPTRSCPHCHIQCTQNPRSNLTLPSYSTYYC